MSRTVGRLLLPGAGLWLTSHGAALAQCAMCNTAAKGSAVGWSLSVSVLFMLVALALVVGWLIVLIARTARSAQRRGDATAPDAYHVTPIAPGVDAPSPVPQIASH